MFKPPCCPNAACEAHLRPAGAADARPFYVRNGFYQPKCRPRPVPRFRCRLCGVGFSRQTFRLDYHDNKPHLNAGVFLSLATGLGLRQSARNLGLSRRCLELKVRKIARHLQHLNRNLTGQFGKQAAFSFDEMETFEGRRGVLPVTVPILVEKQSRFLVAAGVASIRPSGRMNAERRAAVAAEEARSGPRRDDSQLAILRAFRQLAVVTRDLDQVEIVTDKKSVYATLLRRVFDPLSRKIVHETVSSRRRRDARNPLRYSNWAHAMARDLNGRLRRSSWLVSKQRRYLRLQLHIFAAYKNFVRRRINADLRTPAQYLGFVPRPLAAHELLTWRQDWRLRSIHPFAGRVMSIASWRALGQVA